MTPALKYTFKFSLPFGQIVHLHYKPTYSNIQKFCLIMFSLDAYEIQGYL